jgi:adenosylcobinamide-phosphate synthase
MLFLPQSWPLALGIVLLAGIIDVTVGESPAAVHPVVWMGRLIGALEGRRPHDRPRAELVYGVLVVLTVTGACAAAAIALTVLVAQLPWWLALPIGAAALKTTFSLRGLVSAGRRIQLALASDTDAARAGLAALVSRSRDLEPPQIVSATVESLAENLTDSVVSPLLYCVVFGLPGAFVYRAVNTMDAMIGYRGAYEYVGKPAARLDDVLNWVPARLTALLLVMLASLRRAHRKAWACLRSRPHPPTGPNKLVTISAMAGALGVQLAKPGVYAVGPADRPLVASVIGEAIDLVWLAGGIALAVAAGLSALLVWGVGG